jgi:Mg-chelatase subunit ChlD
MKQSGTNFVQSTPGGSGTCCQKAISAILQMANQATSKRKVIVYLSDGGGTCNGGDEPSYLRQTVTLATSQNYQRIPINTIGVIELGQVQEAFMKQLASSNGGTYTRINN